MSQMPTRSFLQSSLNQEFRIEDANGNSTIAILQSVRDGVQMNERFICFAAVFILPHGIGVTQGIYRIRHHGGEWDLLLVPVMPTSQGQHRLEAMIHHETASPPAFEAELGTA